VESPGPTERSGVLLPNLTDIGEGGAIVNVCFPRGEREGVVKDCPRGETGGDLAGRSEMGDGGTNGNASRMESARVEVAERTEEPEILRPLSRP